MYRYIVCLWTCCLLHCVVLPKVPYLFWASIFDQLCCIEKRSTGNLPGKLLDSLVRRSLSCGYLRMNRNYFLVWVLCFQGNNLCIRKKCIVTFKWLSYFDKRSFLFKDIKTFYKINISHYHSQSTGPLHFLRRKRK